MAPVTVTVVRNERPRVLAATVASHGTDPGEPTVLTPGPLLPPELATNTPASVAPRNASACDGSTVDVALPIEKLRTSTPSATASSIAAMASTL